jgi:peptidyl-prolyl cis-trans isomerase C
MTPQRLRVVWWRDPLVHFLVLGAAVFAVHRWVVASAEPNAIVLSQPVVRGLVQEHVRRTGSEPTAEETQALVDTFVGNEILYREALAHGLDRGDIIVRRRLVQKMQFLLENLEPTGTPTEAELQAFLEAHAERYRVPERLTLTHVFISTDAHGPEAQTIASRLLPRLRGGDDASGLGDPFLHGHTFTLRTRRELAGMFGAGFVDQVAGASLGEWSGPVSSSFGWHIVRVTERRPARLPDLAEVRRSVQQDWEEERRTELDHKALERLRQRYEVRVDAPAPAAVAALR